MHLTFEPEALFGHSARLSDDDSHSPATGYTSCILDPWLKMLDTMSACSDANSRHFFSQVKSTWHWPGKPDASSMAGRIFDQFMHVFIGSHGAG